MSAIQPLIELLDSHQRRISGKLDLKLAILAQDVDTRDEALARARWELVRVLREYQLFKHLRIFDPAIRSAGAARGQGATELKNRCEAAGEQYKAHVRKWSFSGGNTDWSSYERDLRQMVDGIRRHLRAESRHIRALLASGGAC